ncbi:FCD domain-containing protein [Desulfosporosinus fructosivorans]|uniref:FCD domain-containing protein n=1 Tax=Desulfosporosinus fructosivorans TaxID=2018669 RepID=A0A4Z0QW83_9FIRM|nr:FCD domain-containing protein [Desulfosporosinus fructosivorans]TGE34774.1 FCD domain-containing protein [Desulfosporosinus fructosivorans]
MLAEQEKYISDDLLATESDNIFHKIIAVAEKNKVLEVALDLIQYNAQLSPILEHVHKQVGGKLVVCHGEIMKGIRARDSEQREKSMVDHIESLIRAC